VLCKKKIDAFQFGVNTMTDTLINAKAHALYDDWQARRMQLTGIEREMPEYHATEIRLLDYLLQRYKGSPEAARPAMFPLPASALIDRRAIVVHHHLRGGATTGIRNRQEADAHVRSALEQMRVPPEEEDDSAAEEAIAEFDRPAKFDLVEALREKLCDADATVRIHAAIKLGEIGGMDDIGLLADVLSVPHADDEHPKERAAILQAMKRLSGMNDDSFDPSDAPSMPKSLAELISDNLEEDGPNKSPIRLGISFGWLVCLSAAILAIGVILIIRLWIDQR
jgi:hypothetical protein